MQGRYRQVGEPRTVKKSDGFYSVGQVIEIDGQKAEVVEVGVTEPRVVMGKRGNLEAAALKYRVSFFGHYINNILFRLRVAMGKWYNAIKSRLCTL
jgi:hypothetical protein